MKDAVMVFTSKSLETMRLEGGTGNWAAKEERLETQMGHRDSQPEEQLGPR